MLVHKGLFFAIIIVRNNYMSIIKINVFNLSLILIFLFFSQNSYSQDQAILGILE